MRHSYFGRKLGRNRGQRRSLFMNLVRALIGKGRVKTTLAKAKAVQPLVEKLITKAKSKASGQLGKIVSTLSHKESYEKLLEMARVRFAARTSGYTRIVRLGARVGDASEMVYLEFVDAAPTAETTKVTKETKVTKGAKETVHEKETEVVSKEKPKRFGTAVKPVRTPRKRS